MKFSAQKVKTIFPLVGAIAVILIAVANIVVSHQPIKQQEVLAATDPWEQEVEFWQDVVRIHPTYRDGYVQLADLYLQKDLKEAAKQAVDKALEIDPFSVHAKELKSQIEE